MAGQIIISNIKTDSDNAFSILANTGAVLFSANLESGITTNIANTRITGNIVSSQITSVSNTQITGTITAGQLATSLNLATNNVQVASIQSATGTPAITFAANGQMTLANTPLQLTSGQIKFPLTKNASADANTLDDYEEGTWTPSVTFGGGSTGVTYSARNGYYTKIGNLVYLTCLINLTSKGSSAGQFRIAGLPFTTTSSTNYRATSTSVLWDGLATSYVYVLGLVSESVTAMDFLGATAASGSTATGIQNTGLSGSDNFRVSILYQV
jgi:hypothetical protein